MIVQGSYEFYKVDGEIDSSVDLSKLIYAINIGELPATYANGQMLLLSFDFAPLNAWKLYKAVANQSTEFNAGEWIEDKINPYIKAIEAADRDGALAEALADGKINITISPTAPLNPQPYDIWQCPAANVAIGELSASDAEAMQKNGTNDVYFYWGIDGVWHLTTMPMDSSIKTSKSTAIIRAKAQVFSNIEVNGQQYVNGWYSLLEYNNGVMKNDFAIVADNFWIGAVGDIVQQTDAQGTLLYDKDNKPLWMSTGETYKPFKINTVDHTIEFDGAVTFKNSNQSSINTLNLTNGKGWTDDTTANAAISALSNIASDNILSPVEKSSVRKEWGTIILEKASIETQATGYSITTETTAYVNAIVALGTYLNAGTAWAFSTTVIPSWIADTNLATNTTIVGSTFRSTFTTYYTARQVLANKINDVIKGIADSKVLPANVAAAINGNTTTIDGGKITANSISANHLQVNTIGSANLMIDALYGKTIKGGLIDGAQIVGAVIKASWIDYSSVGALTNWQAVPVTYLSDSANWWYTYRNNFAKNPDLTPVADSQGYARLPAQSQCYSSPNTIRINQLSNVCSTTVSHSLVMKANIYMPNSYSINTSNRIIKNIGTSIIVSVPSTSPIISLYRIDDGAGYFSVGTFILNGVLYTFTANYGGSTLSSGAWSSGSINDGNCSYDGFTFSISGGRMLSLTSGNYTVTLRDFSDFLYGFTLQISSAETVCSVNAPAEIYASVPLFQIF